MGLFDSVKSMFKGNQADTLEQKMDAFHRLVKELIARDWQI